MNISDAIKGLLAMAGKKQTDLAEVLGMSSRQAMNNKIRKNLGMSSRQAMNNKIRKNSWYASDVIKAAELCGCKLAIVMPDGQQIFLQDNEKSPDA